jgi:hypothetical protein
MPDQRKHHIRQLSTRLGLAVAAGMASGAVHAITAWLLDQLR